MKNGFYPKQKLGNRNVPDNCEVVGSLVTMSGEIVTTYYYQDGELFEVGDWVYCKPRKVTEKENKDRYLDSHEKIF